LFAKHLFVFLSQQRTSNHRSTEQGGMAAARVAKELARAAANIGTHASDSPDPAILGGIPTEEDADTLLNAAKRRKQLATLVRAFCIAPTDKDLYKSIRIAILFMREHQIEPDNSLYNEAVMHFKTDFARAKQESDFGLLLSVSRDQELGTLQEDVVDDDGEVQHVVETHRLATVRRIMRNALRASELHKSKTLYNSSLVSSTIIQQYVQWYKAEAARKEMEAEAAREEMEAEAAREEMEAEAAREEMEAEAAREEMEAEAAREEMEAEAARKAEDARKAEADAAEEEGDEESDEESEEDGDAE
jgi:hypothetical protein